MIESQALEMMQHNERLEKRMAALEQHTQVGWPAAPTHILLTQLALQYNALRCIWYQCWLLHGVLVVVRCTAVQLLTCPYLPASIVHSCGLFGGGGIGIASAGKGNSVALP